MKNNKEPSNSKKPLLRQTPTGVLRSVGDDATSYQGNQSRYVIAMPRKDDIHAY